MLEPIVWVVEIRTHLFVILLAFDRLLKIFEDLVRFVATAISRDFALNSLWNISSSVQKLGRLRIWLGKLRSIQFWGLLELRDPLHRGGELGLRENATFSVRCRAIQRGLTTTGFWASSSARSLHFPLEKCLKFWALLIVFVHQLLR